MVSASIEVIEHGRKQYKTPFKVHCVEWNPRHDLLALASRKGELMVKRNGWKKCWKLTVAGLYDPLSPHADPERKRSIDSIAWCPDGEVLAVGMNDGHIHLIEVSLGSARWSVLLVDETSPSTPLAFKQLRWFNADDQRNKESNTTNIEHRRLQMSLAVAEEHERGAMISDISSDSAQMGTGEHSGERDAQRCSATVANLLGESLLGTIIFVFRDDDKISLLAGGLVQLLEIDLNKELSGYNLALVMSYDLHYSSDLGGLQVVLTSWGPRPRLGIDNQTYGAPQSEPSDVTCCHTHVINLDIETGNTAVVWKMVSRYVRMYMAWEFVETTYDRLLKGWKTESQLQSAASFGDPRLRRISITHRNLNIFKNRLQTPRTMDLGVSLFNLIVPGICDLVTDSWLERSLGSQGLNAMRDFLDSKQFRDLITCLKGSISSTFRAVAFHMQQFVQDVLTHNMETNLDYESILMPKRNMDVSVYPYGQMTGNKENIGELEQLDKKLTRFATMSQAKCNEAIQLATLNLRELYNLVRWLSVLQTFIRSSKNKISALQQSTKCDTKDLIKYVVNNLMVDEELQHYLNRSLYDIAEIIQEMAENDTAMETDNADDDEMTRLTLQGTQGLCSRGQMADRISPPMKLRKKSESMRLSSETPSGPDDGTLMQQQTSDTDEPAVAYLIDKIVDYFSERLSDKTLELLGPRSTLVDDMQTERTTTLDGYVRGLRDCVRLAAGHLAKIASVKKVNWMYELASSSDHQGLKAFGMRRFDCSLDPIFDGELDALVRNEWNRDTTTMRNSLQLASATADGIVKSHLVSISSKDPSSSGKLDRWSRVWNLADQSIWRKFQGDSTGSASTASMETEALTVEIDDGLSAVGQFKTLENLEIGKDGYIYALVSFTKTNDTEVRRLLRLHPLSDVIHLPPVDVRTGRLESLCLSATGRACIVADEGSRCILFQTNGGIEELDTSATLRVEEYRRFVEERENFFYKGTL